MPASRIIFLSATSFAGGDRRMTVSLQVEASAYRGGERAAVMAAGGAEQPALALLGEASRINTGAQYLGERMWQSGLLRNRAPESS
jgi:hypothetical protein